MGSEKVSYKVPDWRTFTVGEHTPPLLKLQKRLAAKGLKDPWIRNEVWRHDITKVPPPRQRGIRMFTRGLVPGIVLALISTAYTKWYESQDPRYHHDHH